MCKTTLFTDMDLMENQEEQTEQMSKTLEEQLQEAREELELVRQERNKLKADSLTAIKLITQLKTAARKERELRLAASRRKPVVLPIMAIVACVVLAILVMVATNSYLVAGQLGEPLTFFFIGCCAFFAGMIWDRCDPLQKLKGGMANGNG